MMTILGLFFCLFVCLFLSFLIGGGGRGEGGRGSEWWPFNEIQVFNLGPF